MFKFWALGTVRKLLPGRPAKATLLLRPLFDPFGVNKFLSLGEVTASLSPILTTLESSLFTIWHEADLGMGGLVSLFPVAGLPFWPALQTMVTLVPFPIQLDERVDPDDNFVPIIPLDETTVLFFFVEEAWEPPR